MRRILAIACSLLMPAEAFQSSSGPAADERSEPVDPLHPTPVTWPTPTTGVAGTQALKPGDAGALNPANVPKPTLAEEVEHVWVRFKQMAHIPPGITAYPGNIRQVPVDHVHPDVHEVLKDDDPEHPNKAGDAVTKFPPYNQTTDEHIPVQDQLTELLQDQLTELYQRVSALEARNATTPPPASPTDPSPSIWDKQPEIPQSSEPAPVPQNVLHDKVAVDQEAHRRAAHEAALSQAAQTAVSSGPPKTE